MSISARWRKQRSNSPRSAAADKAKVYEDYRKLLDEEKSVDAVVIAPGQRWHVPMSKRAMQAGKHVFCEKPLAHSCAQAREIRELAKQFPKLATQVGSQGGSTDTFRRSMEVIQAGVLGQIREVHVWMDRGCPPSRNYDKNADPIPPELNWDFWCGPSKVLPFKNHYLGFCLNWGPWLEFGDGHLADIGAHGLNLPWRALKLGAPLNCSTKVPEPVKDSYPSATDICWDFAARGDMPAVKLWWHDGGKRPAGGIGQGTAVDVQPGAGQRRVVRRREGHSLLRLLGRGRRRQAQGRRQVPRRAGPRGLQAGARHACRACPASSTWVNGSRPARAAPDVPGLRDCRHGGRDRHGGHARPCVSSRA